MIPRESSSDEGPEGANVSSYRQQSVGNLLGYCMTWHRGVWMSILPLCHSSLWTLDFVMNSLNSDIGLDAASHFPFAVFFVGGVGICWNDQSTLANNRPCKVPEDVGQRVGQSSIPHPGGTTK